MWETVRGAVRRLSYYYYCCCNSSSSYCVVVLVVIIIIFHLLPRLCPSTAGCSPPSVPSIVLSLLLACSRW